MKWQTKIKLLFAIITIVYFVNLLSSACIILSLCLSDLFEFTGINPVFSNALFIFFNVLFAAFMIASIYCYYQMKKIIDAYIDAIEKNEELVKQNDHWYDRVISLVSQNTKLTEKFDELKEEHIQVYKEKRELFHILQNPDLIKLVYNKHNETSDEDEINEFIDDLCLEGIKIRDKELLS